MSDPCLSDKELDDFLEASSGETKLRHVQQCPRCRSKLALRRSFLAGDPELADPKREQLLAERVHKVIFGGNQISGNAGMGWSRLLSPLGGGILALAAVLVLCVAINRFQTPDGNPGIHLRGSGSSVAGLLAPAVALDGDSGDLLLSWSSLPGVREYQVEILGGDLAVLEKGITVVKPTVHLKAESLERWRAKSSLLLWRVTAMGDEVILAQSAPQHLAAP
ncbi:MAG: hypothetical protein KAH56_02980 [Candidatus Krumholzibacteria bacterium]|nr:hypothetical protein [Candidatus Krumholzibacteria bacterium]